MVRVRIAPSPTGFLHIGTARTALFNYLFAKKVGGHFTLPPSKTDNPTTRMKDNIMSSPSNLETSEKVGGFILRIEDTDLERSDKKYEKDIFDELEWLGIDADESPEKGGVYGPYRQSERMETYKPYLKKLLDDGNAFYCFHSEEELTAEKERLITQKKPFAHWCEFRDMPLADAEKKLKQNHITRFKTPRAKAVAFHDIIRGDILFKSDLIGDFSIAKDADTPLYNFAVVVDDETMKISHIIRGEDHISNTPKQLLLIEALGFTKPEYAHLPLILGTDRSKLSKRHGATSIMEYRNAGYLPEALFNFMALLGWSPQGNQQLTTDNKQQKELFTAEELIQVFSLEKVQKSGAIFDITKLDWMNGEYVRQKSVGELTKLLLPHLKSQISNLKDFDESYIQKIVALEQPRLKKLSEIGERVEYFFKQPEYDKELLRWKNASDKETADSLSHSEKIISRLQSQIFKEEFEKEFLKEIEDGDKGKILWPLRIALTGKKASPGPFEIMEILGKEETFKRIARAKEKISFTE